MDVQVKLVSNSSNTETIQICSFRIISPKNRNECQAIFKNIFICKKIYNIKDN